MHHIVVVVNGVVLTLGRSSWVVGAYNYPSEDFLRSFTSANFLLLISYRHIYSPPFSIPEMASWNPNTERAGPAGPAENMERVGMRILCTSSGVPQETLVWYYPQTEVTVGDQVWENELAYWKWAVREADDEPRIYNGPVSRDCPLEHD